MSPHFADASQLLQETFSIKRILFIGAYNACVAYCDRHSCHASLRVFSAMGLFPRLRFSATRSSAVPYTRETRNSAIAEGPRDASCQLKSCQLLARNSAETTCTTSPEQIEVMKFEGYRGAMCIKHVHSTVTRSSRF